MASQDHETPTIPPPSSLKATPSQVISPKTGASKDTPSLFRKKEVKAVEEKKPDAPKQENAFEQSAIETAWKAFGDMRIKAGAGDAEKLVLSRDLSKTDGHDISIHLGSQLEMSILDKFEQEVIQYLRKELTNDFINLTKEVKSQVEKQKLYTSQDKFDYMIDQNPVLKDLKDKLGLDFEY